MDGKPTGEFRPDDALTRGELAQYLVMAGSLRQRVPLPFAKLGSDARMSTSKLAPSSSLFPYAEIVTAKGSALRDLKHEQAPVMLLKNNAFEPGGLVNSYDLAYSLVQALALEPTVKLLVADKSFSGINLDYSGTKISVDLVDESIDPAGRSSYTPVSFADNRMAAAYIQIALNAGLLPLSPSDFYFKPSPNFGALPTTAARFVRNRVITRAQYAFSAGQFQTLYQRGEDRK